MTNLVSVIHLAIFMFPSPGNLPQAAYRIKHNKKKTLEVSN